MAKTLVTHADEQERVPFLRGILISSLQDAGLTFEQAYPVADVIRDELKDVAEITTLALKEKIAGHLAPFGDDIVRRYWASLAAGSRVLVLRGDGQAVPFSRGRQRQELSRCGLRPSEAAAAAEEVFELLQSGGVEEIPEDELTRITHDHIERSFGEEAARLFRVWEEFRQSDRPLVILLGGAAGSGKSTVAAELSYLLDIVRSQSTDILREVMRMMVPERMVPVLHTSSFAAHHQMPSVSQEDEEGRLVQGYLAQAELVGVACEAVIGRAIQERVSLILEGVHVHPGLAARLPVETDAIVVPVMLGVLKPKRLRQRIRGRGEQAPGRRAKRYLEHFDDIWRLQGFLLSEADQAGVPIVRNHDLDPTVREVLGVVMKALARHFPGGREIVAP